MKILIDENFPLFALNAIEGVEVTVAGKVYVGKADHELLEIASTNGQTILTFDKDFGELVFLKGIPFKNAVILFRLKRFTPKELQQIVRHLLVDLKEDLPGHFVIVDQQGKLRFRPLPQ